MLIEYIQDRLYEEMKIQINIREFCYTEGFWTRQYLKDDEGNILDYEDVITRKNLQDVCGIFGLNIDCLNW